MVASSLLSFLALIILGVDATPNMARPENFRSQLTPNGANPNHTVSPRSIIESRSGAGMASVGYFTNWGIYGRNFQPSDIPASRLTHILYSFADVSASTGTVVLTDTYADQTKHYPNDSWSESGNNVYGCFKQLYLLKKANRNLKVILSIGGYTYSQSGHFDFVSTPSSRANFVSSSIQLLEDNGLDGIDIDFEYPTAAQSNDFASLLSELRAGLDAHATKKGDTVPYELSVAVPAGSQNYVNLAISAMDKSLTHWNLMAYDYAGAWSNISDDQANLYRGSTKEGVDTDSTIKYYVAQGATPAKITMGIPLYGRAFEETAGLQQPFTGVGTGTWGPGVYDYKALPFAGAQVTEDTTTGSSYSYDATKKELVSYDTPNIAKQKAQYIVSNNLGGSMFWELSSDKTGADSLVSVAAGVFGTLDTTQNHLLYPGSQFANMQTCMGGCSGSSSPSPSASSPAPPSSSSALPSSSPSPSSWLPSSSSSLPLSSTAPPPPPVSSSTSTTSSSSTQPAAPTTSAVVPPSPPSSGSCSGVAAWASGTAYTGGMKVTYGGFLWTALWWSLNDVPGGAAGTWAKGSAC